MNGKQTKGKKSQLNVTPGETVRNSIIKAAEKKDLCSWKQYGQNC